MASAAFCDMASQRHITLAKRSAALRPAAHWLPRVRSSQRRLAKERYRQKAQKLFNRASVPSFILKNEKNNLILMFVI